jgi:cell division protein YceG involved in septum cleavage
VIGALEFGATVVEVVLVVVVVVVVVVELTTVIVCEAVAASRSKYPVASAWTVQVPSETAVMVPFDAMVHTEVVLLRYVTP